MKKLLCTLLALALLCAAAMAENALVTISNGQGEFCMAQVEIDVTDVDEDGVLTVYDALYCAHEAAYPGGAEAGFAAEDTEYGKSLTKLWGEENGGSYGYYVNNSGCDSLATPIDEGVHIQAYAYQDLEGWTDQFCYFDCTDNGDGTYTLTLNGIGFDADWNEVVAPIAGASITVDGADSGLVTDENGSATLSISEAGEHIVSAASADAVLVPPVCKITAK